MVRRTLRTALRMLLTRLIDALIILAVLGGVLAALFLTQWFLSHIDLWLDGLAGRVQSNDCDPAICWPH